MGKGGGSAPAPTQQNISQSNLPAWAQPYSEQLLGQTQALANNPYQVYQGPQTAGESNLQSKVFQGLGGLNFPSNLGQSFSSAGAYQPPPMDMGAYVKQPIGTGQPPMMLNQGSNGFGDFGSMQGQPSRRFATADEAKLQHDPTADDIKNMMANNPFGGQPGQMPQGGLAGLAGRMQQPQPSQPQQEAQQQAQQFLLVGLATPHSKSERLTGLQDLAHTALTQTELAIHMWRTSLRPTQGDLAQLALKMPFHVGHIQELELLIIKYRLVMNLNGF